MQNNVCKVKPLQAALWWKTSSRTNVNFFFTQCLNWYLSKFSNAWTWCLQEESLSQFSWKIARLGKVKEIYSWSPKRTCVWQVELSRTLKKQRSTEVENKLFAETNPKEARTRDLFSFRLNLFCHIFQKNLQHDLWITTIHDGVWSVILSNWKILKASHQSHPTQDIKQLQPLHGAPLFNNHFGLNTFPAHPYNSPSYFLCRNMQVL